MLIYGILVEEVRRRLNDIKLVERINEYLLDNNLESPSFISQGSYFVLSSQLAVLNNEFLYCFKKASEIGLEFLYDTYVEDFYANSKLKRSYVKGVLDKNQRRELEGKRLSEIMIDNDTSLVTYRLEELLKDFPNINIFDSSNFYKNRRAEDYYKFSLVKYILNIWCKGRNEDFENKIIAPNIDKLKSEIGEIPLIYYRDNISNPYGRSF